MELAEEGFPVSHTVANAIAADELLCEFPTSAAIFTRDGRPLRAGEILYQKDLAGTFQKIAQEGSGVFYEGEIAQAVTRFVEEQGGLIDHEGPVGLSGTVAGLDIDRISGILGARGAAQLKRPRAFAGVEPGGAL